jgi:hypothetical protein
MRSAWALAFGLVLALGACKGRDRAPAPAASPQPSPAVRVSPRVAPSPEPPTGTPPLAVPPLPGAPGPSPSPSPSPSPGPSPRPSPIPTASPAATATPSPAAAATPSGTLVLDGARQVRFALEVSRVSRYGARGGAGYSIIIDAPGWRLDLFVPEDAADGSFVSSWQDAPDGGRGRHRRLVVRGTGLARPPADSPCAEAGPPGFDGRLRIVDDQAEGVFRVAGAGPACKPPMVEGVVAFEAPIEEAP